MDVTDQMEVVGPSSWSHSLGTLCFPQLARGDSQVAIGASDSPGLSARHDLELVPHSWASPLRGRRVATPLPPPTIPRVWFNGDAFHLWSSHAPFMLTTCSASGVAVLPRNRLIRLLDCLLPCELSAEQSLGFDSVADTASCHSDEREIRSS